MRAWRGTAPGRAPRPARGCGAPGRRGGARLLPRPVTIGLAGPFARPARTLVTLAAIVFGVTTVIFGFGLRTSLDRVQADLARTASEQVRVFLAGRQGPAVLDGQRSAQRSLAAQEHAGRVA